MLEFLKQLPPWIRVGLLFPLIFLNGWLFYLLIGSLEPLLDLLITASLFAFLLGFPIKFLQKLKFSRGIAITVVLLLALLVITILAVIFVPIIVQQLSELIINLPKWIDSSSQQLQVLQQWAVAQELSLNLTGILAEEVGRLSNAIQSLSSQLLNFLLGTISSIVNIVIILVLTVFLVFTGEKVWQGIFSWFPSPWNRELPASIQKTFTTYFASQAILAGILSLAQMVVFIVLNVPYALLFAVAIGMTTLVPYASSLTIIIISFLLMLQNFWLGLKVLIAAVIVGQINDNLIAPRVVGGMTGLNPVWMIVAIFIGGKLGGILGLLIAVPLASVIKSTADKLRNFEREWRIESVGSVGIVRGVGNEE